MKNGYRVFDADTHVNPAAEVLERYIDPDFRPRLAELAQYRLPASRASEGGDSLHIYRIATKYYRRILGEAGPRESFSGRETRWRGSKMPRPGVQDDQAANRVADMDDEGTDVQFLIPGSWMSLVGLPDPSFEVGMIRAYHRHMADFCSPFPDRLKGLIVGSGRNVDEAVREIRAWGKSKWAVVVSRFLRPAARRSRSRPDLACRSRSRSAGRTPQLDLEPALLSGLSRRLGQHLPRPHGVASLGCNAVCRVVYRRRHL